MLWFIKGIIYSKEFLDFRGAFIRPDFWPTALPMDFSEDFSSNPWSGLRPAHRSGLRLETSGLGCALPVLGDSVSRQRAGDLPLHLTEDLNYYHFCIRPIHSVRFKRKIFLPPICLNVVRCIAISVIQFLQNNVVLLYFNSVVKKSANYWTILN